MVFVELSALAVARHIGIFQLEALFTAIQGQIWFNMNIVSLNDAVLILIQTQCVRIQSSEMKCITHQYPLYSVFCTVS